MRLMWLELTRGSHGSLVVTNHQTVRTTADIAEPPLQITTTCEMDQEVLLTTPRMARLRYRIQQLEATLALEGQPPTPWPKMADFRDRVFEIMLTDRGAMTVPGEGPRLPPEVAAWLTAVAEDVRSAWAIPPTDAKVGTEWKSAPIVPGGLPGKTCAATTDVSCRLRKLTTSRASMDVLFTVALVLHTEKGELEGNGRGQMTTVLDKAVGPIQAQRTGNLDLLQHGQTVQAVTSLMSLQQS